MLEYARELVAKITSAKDQREYRFARSTTEVRQAVVQMVANTKCSAFAQTVADRLLQTEKTAQKRVEHMGVNIQKGDLFQIAFKDGSGEMVLIAKVDLNSFIDRQDHKKHAGLPFERCILKTCLVQFSGKMQIEKVNVSDPHHAEYWWKDFLELEAVKTDENNTKIAFYAIDHLLANRLKRNHPSDYTYLRNNLIGFFRTQKTFSFEGLQNHVFGTYKPDDPKLKMDTLKADVQKLPEKHKFDTAFNIVENAVKARFRRVIPLTDKIKLELTDNVENLSSTIEAKQIGGNKGIFIKSEPGYQTFHRSS